MFNFITIIFQKYVYSRDLRQFKKNFIYYAFFRLIRKTLTSKIKIKIYNIDIWASNKKNEMSHSLLRKCDFEDNQEIRLIDKINKDYLIYLFDCGANFGFYSLYVASKNKENKVCSFEASPSTFYEMKQNINLNKYKTIEAKNLAVSNVDGEMLNFFESEKDWESSISHSNFKNKSKIEVNSVTLDNFSKSKDLNKYSIIIKLDVEGHEMQVIDGSLSLIKKHSPIIILEFSKFIKNNKNYDYSYLKNFLTKYNYYIYNSKYELTSLEKIIYQIENLPNNMYGIGNIFLIKKKSKFENIIQNVRSY